MPANVLALNIKEAVRAFSKRKLIFLVGFLTLALGLGLCTTIFSILYGVLLRPLSFQDPKNLMVVWGHYPDTPASREQLSERTFEEWRRQSKAFTGFAAIRYQGLTILAGGEPEEIPAAVVSPELFPLLGVQAQIGSVFGAKQAQAEQGKLVLLSQKVWRDRFGGDPGVVGKPVRLEGEVYTIVGVMPADFDVPSNATGLWIPLLLNSGSPASKGNNLIVIGRLRPAVTIEQAQGDMDNVARRLQAEYPDTHKGLGVQVVPFFDELVRESRPVVVVLSVAALLILLICCANLANLLLARTIERRRELAVRSAMGAKPAQLVNLILTESLLLALCGGIAGALLARWMTRMLIQIIPVELPRTADIGHGFEVPALSILLVVLTTLLVGVLPAWEAGRSKLVSNIKLGAGASSRRFARQILVTLEVALALILLVSSGLMARTILELQRADPGWKVDHLLASQVFLRPYKYTERHQTLQFFETLIEQLRSTPGVKAVAASSALPNNNASIDFEIPVQVPERPTENDERASVRVVTPGYFNTMGIPLLEGRDFTQWDRDPQVRIMMVNRTFAKKFFPDAPRVVGRRVAMALRGAPAEYEIVGVVKDIHHYGMFEEPRPEFYLPFQTTPMGGMGVVVRTEGDPLAFAPEFRKKLWSIDPELPLTFVNPMDQMVQSSFRDRKFLMVVLALFAGVAVALTILGVFGVVSFSVNQQVREIGIRMAVGARAQDVVIAVLKQVMGVVWGGLALGFLGSWLLSRWLRTMVYGVSATDPLIFLGGALLVVLAAWFGAVLPARRASRIDPVLALRTE